MFFNTQSNHYKNDTKGYSQTILNKSRWNLKKYPYNPTVKQEKNSPGMSAKRNKEKANKIADWNSDISVIILNEEKGQQLALFDNDVNIQNNKVYRQIVKFIRF